VFLKGELQEFPERYQDVRGLIISDYQEYIEKEWVKRLREKYPIQIFEDVKKTLH
jgi:peptidyl-prolyl cis-trans isomerase SurA